MDVGLSTLSLCERERFKVLGAGAMGASERWAVRGCSRIGCRLQMF